MDEVPKEGNEASSIPEVEPPRPRSRKGGKSEEPAKGSDSVVSGSAEKEASAASRSGENSESAAKGLSSQKVNPADRMRFRRRRN
jgi:hypothetical protein